MKKFNNIPNKFYKVDDKIIWDSRSVAVIAFIILEKDNDIYVLIGQRGTGAPDNNGLWNCPCGYLDRNETGSEAIDREVWEETGFDIDTIKNPIIDYMKQPWFVNTDPSENRQNVSLRYGAYFKSDILPELTDENSEPNEIADLKWEKVKNLDKYDWAYNHDKKIVEFLELINDKL